MNHFEKITKSLGLGVALVSGSLIACSTTQKGPETLAQGANCQQLAETKTLSDFYQPGSVVSAQPIEQRIFKARANQPVRTMGAALYVQAEPGMNAPYLRRVLACHAASGQSAHPNDPLHPQGGHIAGLSVSETEHRFRVEVLADTPSVGSEIWQRAESMSQSRGTVQVEQVGAGPELSGSF